MLHVRKRFAGGLAAIKKLKGIFQESMLFQVYKALVEIAEACI